MADGYRRELGPFSATMIIAGSMIGSGIFIVSADIVRLGHSGAFLMAAWGFAALLTILGALSYGELAGMLPHAGGPYIYLREAFGPPAGFLFGWTAFTVVECGGIAAVSAGFGKYLGTFLPWVSDGRWLLGPLHLPSFAVGAITVGPYEFGLTSARLSAIGVILLLSAANVLGVRLGAGIQNVFTLAKVGALLALIGLGFWLAPSVQPSGIYLPPASVAPLPVFAALMVAQVGAMFSADGWYYVTYLAAEVKDPRRTLPRALLFGTGAILLLYLLANLVYLRVLGPAAIATAPEDRVGSMALRALLGPTGERVMALAILVSMFGFVNGTVMTAARLYQAMATHGLFLRRAARLNSRGVPAFSIGVQAAWSCLLTLSGSFDQLLDFVLFATLLFYALAVAGVIVLRRKRPELERPYRVPLYPIVPLAYLAGVLAILGSLLLYRPAYTWPGLVIVLLGIPVYRIHLAREARALRA
jgi:APA family basic amino acid/polyamine antiporter